jgi:IclR family transcriptional regulator, pca regulon regulatory protein
MSNPSPAENPKNFVASAAKIFSVIKAFGTDLPELTVTEIAARAVLDRGTAFRLAHTLASMGYLQLVPGSRRFRLTLKCLELGFAALTARDLPTHAKPLLQELVPGIADAGSLGAVERGEVIYLQRVESGLSRHAISRRPGSRTGAYAAALGHAILAFLPHAEQIAHLESVPRVKLSERTLTDLDELLTRFERVRAQGFAVSDGENAYGLRTVAAPVLDAAGLPLAGVSLTIPASRMGIEEFLASAVAPVRRVADELGLAIRQSLGAIAVVGAGG